MVLVVTKLLNYRSCDECIGKLIEEDGYLVCSSCGLVHEKIILLVNYPTDITYRKKVLSGASDSCFDGHYNRKFNKLARLQKQFKYYGPFVERKDILERICGFLNLNQTARLRALKLFKYYCENRKFIGNRFEMSSNFLAASIIQAVNENRIPITLDQLFETFARFNLRVNRRAVIKHRIQNNHKARMTVKDYVFTYEEKLLHAKPELKRETEKIQKIVPIYSEFQGYKPSAFAVTILYVIYKKQKVTAVFLNSLFDVSLFSIVQNSHKIRKRLQAKSSYSEIITECK